VLFSESHSRYLLITSKKNLSKLESLLKKHKTTFKLIGQFKGKNIQFTKTKKSVIDLKVEKAQKVWSNSLKDLVLHN